MKIGDKYGLLKVLNFSGPRNGKVIAECECGVIKTLSRAAVKSGNTKSCGCLKISDVKARFTKHGAIKYVNGKRKPSPEYRAWQLMRNRCLNAASKDYQYYGGRGIKIDPAWESFTTFLKDVGNRPTAKYSLDRIDPNKGYTKDNCRWATRQTQARNRPYAKTKSWELAEKLNVKITTAAHYIWMARAKQKGLINYGSMSAELEQTVLNFIEGVN